MKHTPSVNDRVAAPPPGESFVIRPATGADGTLIVGLLLQLSNHSRYLRYHVAWRMSYDAAQREAERMLSRDGDRMALLVLRRGDDEHETVAVGELVPTGDGNAELALLVRDDLQRRGIGTRLAQALLDRARALGLRRVRADVLAENRGARRLFSSLGLRRLDIAGFGTLQFEATLTG